MRIFLLCFLVVHVCVHAERWDSSTYVWNMGIVLGTCAKGFNPEFSAYYSRPDSWIKSSDYKSLKAGDIVWVQCPQMAQFCREVLPNITQPIVLVVSLDSDLSFPSESGVLVDILLKNPYIAHIFAQNCDYTGSSTKISRIPIGMDFHSIAAYPRTHGETGTVKVQEARLNLILKKACPTRIRKKRIFVDFQLHDSLRTGELKRSILFGEDRHAIFERINQTGLVDSSSRMRRSKLWGKKIEYAFSVSPHGNGLDCHRTWEDLVLGCIVIVKTSVLDPLYEGLPVVIVKDWSEITQENLDKWLEMYGDAFTNPVYREKLTNYYWVSKIEEKSFEIQQEVMVQEARQKLGALRNMLMRDKKSSSVLTLVKDLVKSLDPKEKRRADFAQRMIVGQQEAQAYAVRKNAPEPVISFYIPVYNRENVVSDAIESIYNQKLTIPFEVVVVDDASTDKTCEVLEQYEKKYNNFFLYKHDVNKKAPAARNTGIVHCRGPWLFNVDSDDVLLPCTVQELLDAVQKKGADSGLFGEYHFFKNFSSGTIVRVAYGTPPAGFAVLEDCLKKTDAGLPFTPGCRLFSKKSVEAVGGFIDAAGHDTWAFSFLQLAHGVKTFVLPACGYLHRLWSNRACYTSQQISKNWSISPITAMSEYEELFDAQSRQTLNEYKRTGVDFFSHGIEDLHMLEPKNLSRIQELYSLRERGEYAHALKLLCELEELGCTHIRLSVYKLEAALCTGARDLALRTIDRLEKLLYMHVSSKFGKEIA